MFRGGDTERKKALRGPITLLYSNALSSVLISVGGNILIDMVSGWMGRVSMCNETLLDEYDLCF